MWFQVVIPQGTSGYDDMGITFGGGNTPHDGTAFMLWFRQNNPYDYVALSLTNGGAFGLTSVRLADPTAPSPAAVPIAFVGLRTDGSTVTNTFTTPGNGANSFLSYQFGPSFASGLLSVRIDAPHWAMDDLVWVPEPGAAALMILGVLAMVLRRRRDHAGCVKVALRKRPLRQD